MCDICCEDFNRTTRREVECLYCGHHACHKCVEKFLVENTIRPKCMSCYAEWNTEFLRTMLSRTFMDKSYRDFQKDVLLSEAESTLGDLQEVARFEDKKEKMEKAIKEKKDEIRRAKRELDIMTYQYHRMLDPPVMELIHERNFFMACPDGSCRGRLSTGYKCGLCEQSFCSKCHGKKHADHACIPDEVETIRVLKENTRNCPKCKMGIYKVSGCDQMWCTSCHTCFSWKSGNILNGPVHNPHFFEFARRQGGAGRQLGDIPCGGFPTVHQVAHRIRNDPVVMANAESLKVYEILRLANHITDVTMVRAYHKFNDRPRLHQQYGVQFLRGLIDRLDFRDRLYKATRQEEKYRRYYQVMEALTHNIAEAFRAYIAGASSHEELLSSSANFFLWTNQAIDEMNKQFHTKLVHVQPFMDTTKF